MGTTLETALNWLVERCEGVDQEAVDKMLHAVADVHSLFTLMCTLDDKSVKLQECEKLRQKYVQEDESR